MSAKSFETFLIEMLLDDLRGKVEPGRRFQFSVRNRKDCKMLKDAVEEVAQTEASISIQDFKIPTLDLKPTQLVVVMHGSSNEGGCSEHFIAHIRDLVAAQETPFQDCALLILHSSMLDTIINSATELRSGSSIWSRDKIYQEIKNINKSKTRSIQLPNDILLDFQYRQLTEQDGTMFGFRSIYQSVVAEQIPDLTDMRMFPDSQLEMMDNRRQIEQRLYENQDLYDMVATTIDYEPDQLRELDLDPKLLYQWQEDLNYADAGNPTEDMFINDGWAHTDFQTVADARIQDGDARLVLKSVSAQSSDILIGPRIEGTSKAKKRRQHLMLLASSESNRNQLIFHFMGGDLTQEQVEFRIGGEKRSAFSVEKGRKSSQIKLQIPFTDEVPRFCHLKLKRDHREERYEFFILVLRHNTFPVEQFANGFLINTTESALEIELESGGTDIQVNPALEHQETLERNHQEIDVTQVGIVDTGELLEDYGLVTFRLCYGQVVLKVQTGSAQQRSNVALPLLFELGGLKNIDSGANSSAKLLPEKNIILFENREYRARARAVPLLHWEQEVVQQRRIVLGGTARTLDTLDSASYPGADPIFNAYRNLLDRLAQHETTPSLMAWSGQLHQAVESYVTAFLEYLKTLPDNASLASHQQEIIRLGTLDGVDLSDLLPGCPARHLLTSFTPLSLAYYLDLAREIREDEEGGFRRLPPVSLKRLNPRGLLPYIPDGRDTYFYTEALEENPLWITAQRYQDTHTEFVPRLIREKIREFFTSFATLFQQASKPRLIINSVGNGDNQEIFEGVFEFFCDELGRRSRLIENPSIHVNIYDEITASTRFEHFAEQESYESIKREYNLTQGKRKAQSDALIDILRRQLTFSKFGQKEELGYAHITIFRNRDALRCVGRQALQHPTGLGCDGLLNGETSSLENDNYYTAMGFEDVEIERNLHLDIAFRLNALLKAAYVPGETYTLGTTPAFMVSRDLRNNLERCYRASVWTTIIDPRVTLDFFGNNQDMLLIHFSDQYTNTAGYDAITVTTRTELYRHLLQHDGEERLKADEARNLICEFNAFSGEWLLRMLTDAPPIRKGKLGIIAAWKLVSALLADSDMIWVPLSVDELVRVSSNTGLRMTQGDFSRYHKWEKFSGVMSDDVLFVGFRENHLVLLPVEVKTGGLDRDKAVEQAKKLRQFMTETLGATGLDGRLYRAMFARHVLMQIERYELYQTFEVDYFKPIRNRRTFWLNGDYLLTSLNGYAQALVVAHEENPSTTQAVAGEVDDVLVIRLPSMLNHLIRNPRKTVWQHVRSGALSIPKQARLERDALQQAIYTTEFNTHENESSVAPSRESDPSDAMPLVSSQFAVTPVPQPSTIGIPITVGWDRNTEKPIRWEPNNTEIVMKPNLAIIGTMGTGKTQSTKSIVSQLIKNQHHNVDAAPLGILILDYKGDYIKDSFAEAVEAKILKLEHLPFNPLALFGNKPRLPVHVADTFKDTIGSAFNLGVKQKNRLVNAIMKTYMNQSISPSDPTTWSNPAPTLAMVWDELLKAEKIEEDSLFAAMNTLVPHYAIFEPDPAKTKSLFDLVQGVTVIDLSGYPPSTQNLVVAITTDLFYIQMHQQGSSQVQGDLRQLTRFLLVDEADNFMSGGFTSLKKIMKEAREFGVGVILSTQELAHFNTGEDNYAKYVENWIIHRVGEMSPQDINTLFQSRPANSRDIIGTINGLQKHQSLFLDGGKHYTAIEDSRFYRYIAGDEEAKMPPVGKAVNRR